MIDKKILDNTLVIILNGGLGTRIHDVTNGEIPKGLVTIGDKTITEHIIDHYIKYGFKYFAIATGHLFDKFASFDSKYAAHDDIIVNSIFTGANTQTAGRIYRILEGVSLDRCQYIMVTYGDGIADIDLEELVKIHIEQKTLGTITIIPRPEQFGIVELETANRIKGFREKPRSVEWINGGFMIFNTIEVFVEYKRIFERLIKPSNAMHTVLHTVFDENLDKLTLETHILPYLSFQLNSLAAYQHYGYWHCMDTFKDYLQLQEDYKQGLF